MSPKTILYVEDNELNRRIVRDLLKRTSYRLLEAPDGETSLDIVRRERPDLILISPGPGRPEEIQGQAGVPASRRSRGSGVRPLSP